jgi:hypothetical protein
MRGKGKRGLVLFAVLAMLVEFVTQAHAAIKVDGNVGNLEWYDYQPIVLISPGDNSMCGVSFACVRFAVNDEKTTVIFALNAQATGFANDGRAGLAFFVGGKEIARYQQNESAVDETNYHISGAFVNMNSYEGDFMMEVALDCKTPEAFAALEHLVLHVIDPVGVRSLAYNYPILTEEPTTVPKPTTTAKATATKASTTEKTTTTKAPTTEKTTTTKAPTTAKPTATTTQAPPSIARATTLHAAAILANQVAATTAFAAGPTTPAPGAASTEKPMKTVDSQAIAPFSYSAAPPLAAAAPPAGPAASERATLWTYTPLPDAPGAAAQSPADDDTAATSPLDAPAAQNPKRPLLFAGGALLLAAGGLVAFWRKGKGDAT